MAIQRKRVCNHCTKEFVTSQYSAKYCSTSCKTKSRNNKTANNRIEKLPVSDSWLWIARECRRAGTVEILQDVDLEQLFEVYNRRYKCYGWDSEKQVSKFHLCHISPVSGDSTIGLLHHENLFIGGSLANQVQGKKSYKGAGKSISRSSLKRKWLINNEESDKAILAKVQKYLGSKLTEYAKKHPIKKAQRFVLAERISKLPENKTPLADLQRMGTQALMKLEADLLNKSVFSIKLIAKRSLVVYLEELERFASYESAKQENFLFVAAAVRVVAQYLDQQQGEHGLSSITAVGYRWYYDFKPLTLKPEKDLGKLRDFISFTAFSTLQGAEVDRSLISNTLRSYLLVETLTVVENGNPAYDTSFSDFEYLQTELDEFLSNVPKVKDALSVVGLLDSSAMLRISEKEKETSFVQAFKTDMQTKDYWQYDYSEHGIQVEDEYNLPLLSAMDSWLPF
ncbi:hypothetical protein [Aquipseudomonas alcaligenes]|uniref:hypothetical protein n=1 Tax=Aquipseudomonas alcaligenes TaxID=43263 RepID=UPI002431A5A4|nr:hypothetical protein [Pseudomonas alcaligenes]